MHPKNPVWAKFLKPGAIRTNTDRRLPSGSSSSSSSSKNTVCGLPSLKSPIGLLTTPPYPSGTIWLFQGWLLNFQSRHTMLSPDNSGASRVWQHIARRTVRYRGRVMVLWPPRPRHLIFLHVVVFVFLLDRKCRTWNFAIDCVANRRAHDYWSCIAGTTWMFLDS